MNFRNISAWSIRNPVPPIVLFIALAIAGLVSFSRMDVQNDPDIDFPVAIVTIAQPGAAPTELENQVTRRVESAVRSIQGVDEINSSVSEGNSSTFIQLDIGTPIDRTVNDIRDAITQIRGDLPDGILEPQIGRVNTSGNDLASFSVVSTAMTLEELSWYIDNTVTRELLAVPGMAAVERSGGVTREIRVDLDPAKMQSLGITASQVNAQLRQLNLNAAGGRAEISDAEQSVRVLGNARNAFQLGETQISLGAGRTVRLSDIARVSDAYAEQRNYSTQDGQQVLSFSFQRAKGESDVTVFDGALEVLKKLEERNPEVRFVELSNNVKYTKEQYHSSMLALIEGAVLAVIVVFLFLRDWRATVISALAIPLSAIPAFWFMDLMGFTLNSLTLLALALVSGVLVDDAIVEIENIVRHMRMGKSAYQAAIDAADEIGLAVLATTMVIVSVFLPVGLMPGISGEFFKNFGLTVVVSVLMSLAVARMITPMMAAYFLKAQGQASHGEGPMMDRYMKLLEWSLDRSGAIARRARFTKVESRAPYFFFPLAIGLLCAGMVGWQLRESLWIIAAVPVVLGIGFLIGLLLQLIAGLLVGLVRGFETNHFLEWSRSVGRRIWARLFDHRTWIVGLAVASFGWTIYMFTIIPQTFQPPFDQDESSITVEMAPGTTLEHAGAVAAQVEALVRQEPEVESVFTRVRVGGANLNVKYKPKEERTRTSIEFERAVGPKLQAVADARVSFRSQFGGFTGRELNLTLGGDDPEELNRVANQIVLEMQGLPELVAPRVSGDLRRPEIILTPRLDLAADLGVSTASLSQAIRIATLGDIDQNSARFSLSDRQIPIRVKMEEDARAKLANIENLQVPTATGGSVPLKLVADISYGSGPTRIERTNLTRRVTIGTDLAPGVVSGTAWEKINNLPSMKELPVGVSRVELGMEKWQGELIMNFIVAVLSGIALVFGVLVLLYRRLMPPLVNMSSLLLAPLGGTLALWLLDMPISMPVYIGILMLLGIVGKNSILLVDFALEEMDKGVDKFAAILDAGHKRAQPIVMTTVAMVAGMVPTALALSGDGAWRQPMGVVVIGGLLVSTLLTLIIVPALFSLAVGVEQRAGPWLRRKLLTFKPGDDRHDRPDGTIFQPAE
jgi:multidrug efflux pump subunit AcrB